MINVKNILLTQEELNKCIEFSQRSAPNQQAVEYGEKKTVPRKPCEIARDNLIGKIAEVAFSKMLKENYDIEVPLDFNYYPRGKWDDQDAVINGWKFDVKGTKKGGHWLLIEWNKLDFRQKENKLSHIYVMFSVGWNKVLDYPTGIVSYEGAASLRKLCASCPTTKILQKGDKLPDTKTDLQADNYGIQFKDLYKHLDHLVSYITEHRPPIMLTQNFVNPYTGQTTAQIISDNQTTPE